MEKTKTSIVAVLSWIGLYLCLPASAFSSNLVLQDFIDGVEVKGDLRIRYDYENRDDGKDDANDRLRHRFRLGMKWKNPTDQWEVASGLITGDIDGNTGNKTYSEDQTFETGDIRLDYAYAKHNLDQFVFAAGQQKNMFYSTMALWDPDVRPAGVTGQIHFEPTFLTVGYYQVRHVDRDIARMAAAQAGVEMNNIIAAVGYYDVNRVDEFLDVENLDPDYKYRILDVYVEAEVKNDNLTIMPFGQIFYNLGAEGEMGQSVQGSLDPEEENLGWLVGAEAKISKFKCSIEYGQVGADACVQDIKDSDWGSGLGSTDIEGWKASVGYKLLKNCEFSITGYYTEPMERKNNSVEDVKRAQIDLKYKF